MSDIALNIQERTADKPMPSPFLAKVVGLSFRTAYPHNILNGGSATQIRLAAYTDNEHDPYAVAVIGTHNDLLGYLPRAIAWRLHNELLHNPKSWIAETVEVLIHPDNPNQPGLLIRCRRKEQPDG